MTGKVEVIIVIPDKCHKCGREHFKIITHIRNGEAVNAEIHCMRCGARATDSDKVRSQSNRGTQPETGAEV